MKALGIVLTTALLAVSACSATPDKTAKTATPAATSPGAAAATPNTSERTLRLVGIIEAVRSYSVMVPRLRGQGGAPLVLTRLARGGTHASQGDIVAELDSQDQDRMARDRRATVLNLEEQIRRMQADQIANQYRDDTEITVATSDVERARLNVTTNKLLPKLDAEKNDLVLEQNEARLNELKKTYELKRSAAAADMKILEIRRDRAKQELEYAEQNVNLMIMKAPFPGLVVPKTTFRNGQNVEIIEGDETRPGMPIVDVVDPTSMRARVRINQGDLPFISLGQSAKVYLDAYPELLFDGRVDAIAPIAVASAVTPAVRTFNAVVTILTGHEKLMPDLTAAVELKIGKAGN